MRPTDTAAQNLPNAFAFVCALFVVTRSTLKRTVFDSGRHCPTVTMSPTSTRNAGETCAARFLWRFSYRSARRGSEAA
jgi:hypothetical protein